MEQNESGGFIMTDDVKDEKILVCHTKALEVDQEYMELVTFMKENSVALKSEFSQLVESFRLKQIYW